MPLIEMDPNGVWARSPRWGKIALVPVIVGIMVVFGVILYALMKA